MHVKKLGVALLMWACLILPQGAWGADAVREAMNRSAQKYFHYAMVLGGEARYDEAVKALDQAIGAKPDFAEAYSMKGSCLEKLGNDREAETAYRKALQINPSYGEGYYYLGNLLKKMGKTAEAETMLQKARQFQR